MKLNWGSDIAIFYSLFVAVMIFMVIKSTQNTVHMVQDDYYEKDLNYESFRQKRQNGAAFSQLLKVAYNTSSERIEISFPKELSEVKGELTLFRPSNQFLDKNYPIALDSNGQMFIDVDDRMVRGKWLLQLNWEHLGREFYNEETLIL